MSQRDTADTIEDIYGFEISHETISDITDRVVETVQEWQNRPHTNPFGLTNTEGKPMDYIKALRKDTNHPKELFHV